MRAARRYSHEVSEFPPCRVTSDRTNPHTCMVNGEYVAFPTLQDKSGLRILQTWMLTVIDGEKQDM